jgi:hypothetical protein
MIMYLNFYQNLNQLNICNYFITIFKNKKTNSILNSKIFHAAKRKDEKHRTANYDALIKSEAVLAVVTSKFQEDEVCVAELSYAHRNLIPTSILMDDSVNLATESEIKEIVAV